MRKANHKHEFQFAWTTHGHMDFSSTEVHFFGKCWKLCFCWKNRIRWVCLLCGNAIFYEFNILLKIYLMHFIFYFYILFVIARFWRQHIRKNTLFLSKCNWECVRFLRWNQKHRKSQLPTAIFSLSIVLNI